MILLFHKLLWPPAVIIVANMKLQLFVKVNDYWINFAVINLNKSLAQFIISS